MTWTSGYVAEVDYTFGYYRELNPLLMRLACLSAGVSTPAPEEINYLELGFGQGLSLNIHAAAFKGEFWGTDFNPNQVAQARFLAEASNSQVKLFDEAFADFARRDDLPEFDVIALHGIWTWISDENRRVIVDLIRRKLKVGGLAYVSYNCLPGWAPAMPLRHLMTQHAELAGSEAAGIVNKIDGALAFAQQVVDSGALYFQANPAIAQRLKGIADQNRNYLAHEYFNLDWDIMAFSDVARMLDDAKLTFLASAHLMDHVEAVNLTEAGQKLLGGITHPILRQSVRDYFVNQQFRRDIFIKGVHRLSSLETAELFQAQTFVLTSSPDTIPMKVIGSLGEATLQEQVYRPLIDALSEDQLRPKLLGELAAHKNLKALSLGQLVQAILVLTGAGHVSPAQAVSSAVVAKCNSLNRSICDQARGRADISFLASPVTGGGVPVPRFEQLFLSGGAQGRKTPKDLGSFVWDALTKQGQRIIKDGQILERVEDNLDELTRQAEDFQKKRAPVLKALGVS